MRFQQRDGEICQAIDHYGGVLARRHLKSLFWSHAKTMRALQKRVSKLVINHYLARPTDLHRRTKPIPEPTVYWLDHEGILWVAGQKGVKVNPPASQNENQMRGLANRLRDQGIRWLREPRWIQLYHDLKVVDFQMATEKAIDEVPAMVLDQWVHEYQFRVNRDTVEYTIKGRDGGVKREKKQVRPDSYFVIADRQRQEQGLPSRARFLLEIDGGTHSRGKFVDEKVVPGLAYIKSPQYKARFGDNSGRWLVVTTGKQRMENLIEWSERAVGRNAQAFWFSFFDKLDTDNVLTEAIWWQAGTESKEPKPLIDYLG